MPAFDLAISLALVRMLSDTRQHICLLAELDVNYMSFGFP
jgi:hypothetical protein